MAATKKKTVVETSPEPVVEVAVGEPVLPHVADTVAKDTARYVDERPDIADQGLAELAGYNPNEPVALTDFPIGGVVRVDASVFSDRTGFGKAVDAALKGLREDLVGEWERRASQPVVVPVEPFVVDPTLNEQERAGLATVAEAEAIREAGL